MGEPSLFHRGGVRSATGAPPTPTDRKESNSRVLQKKKENQGEPGGCLERSEQVEGQPPGEGV